MVKYYDGKIVDDDFDEEYTDLSEEELTEGFVPFPKQEPSKTGFFLPFIFLCTTSFFLYMVILSVADNNTSDAIFYGSMAGCGFGIVLLFIRSLNEERK